MTHEHSAGAKPYSRGDPCGRPGSQPRFVVEPLSRGVVQIVALSVNGAIVRAVQMKKMAEKSAQAEHA